MKRMTKPAVFAVTVLLLSFGSAFANEGLPADRVIVAMQTAVAANPGLITEVEVEREGGRLIVEVEIVNADGKQIEVKVDPETNAVLR